MPYVSLLKVLRNSILTQHYFKSTQHTSLESSLKAIKASVSYVADG